MNNGTTFIETLNTNAMKSTVKFVLAAHSIHDGADVIQDKEA